MSLGEFISYDVHHKDNPKGKPGAGMRSNHDFEITRDPRQRWLWISNFREGSPMQFFLFDDGNDDDD